jgi:hypothetical protein
MLRRIAALACAAGVACVSAQPAPESPDWKELDAPAPPALRTQGLIPVEVPGTTLRFGVDPASLTVGDDGVVRYVVVASSPGGAVNGIYEGIRCSSGEVKVYARHNPDSGWVPVRDAQWQQLRRVSNSQYSLAIARNGVCLGNAPNGKAAQILIDLRAPIDRRFERGGVNR